jgi:hypothetical protein
MPTDTGPREMFGNVFRAMKKAAGTAKDKAVTAGDIGIIKIDIGQLKNRLKQKQQVLGALTADMFLTDEHKTISRDAIKIKEILEEIREITIQLSVKENELAKLKTGDTEIR